MKRPRLPQVKFPIPFRMGDVVEEIAPRDFEFSNIGGSNAEYQKERFADWKRKEKGRKHIIHDVKMRNEGYFDYSTDHGAWYPHTCFKLVEESNVKTLNKLLRDQRMEDDGNFEE